MNTTPHNFLDLLDSDELRSQPFQAPQGYLEEALPQAVFQEIARRQPPVVLPRKRPRPVFRLLSRAAVGVLFLGLGLGLGYLAWHESQASLGEAVATLEVVDSAADSSPYTITPEQVVEYLSAYGVQYEHLMGEE